MPRSPVLRVFVLITFLYVSLSGFSQSKAAPPATVADPTPFLGLRFTAERAPLNLPGGTKTAELAIGAPVIDYVYPNSPALQAGIRNGDVLLAMNGTRTCSSGQASEIISRMKPGNDIELIVFRDGGLTTIKTKLASVAEVFPNAELLKGLQKQIDDAAAVPNYKQARELCKRLPDDQQVETSLSCIDAYRNRWDYKELRKAVEGLRIRCRDCLHAAFAHSWEQSPTTDEGIRANAAAANLIKQYKLTQSKLFQKMDRDYANSIANLPPSELITKYENMAYFEGSCRDVPPSAPLVELMVHFAKQNNTMVLEDARKKAAEARNMEQSAKDAAGAVGALRKWNEAIWISPWWSEPYVRVSALFDRLGRPQEAAEVSKLALLIPTAPAAPVQIATPTPVSAGDSEPASEDSLRRCVGALEKTEKGGDAERNARQRCARIAGKLPSKPAVPDVAQRHFARGEAALELGQSPAEFQDAAIEYENALRIAPWWAEAHCGLGQANEKAARLQDAIYAYQACVAAAPNATNVPDIQKRIYKLEYAADREQKQAINAQIQQRELDLRMQALTGVWINKSTGNPYSAVIRDGLFVATRTPPSDRYNKFQGDYVIKGTIKGDKIEGTYTEPPLYNTTNGCTRPVSELPLNGTISPDGRMMTIKYQSATFQTNGIRGNLFNEPRCTFLQKIGEQTIMMILEKQQ